MKYPYQDICQPVVLLEDDIGDSNDDQQEKIGRQRVGRRARHERLGHRAKTSTKKALSAPAGEKELQELMQLCQYEVAHDPYRGMGFLSNGNDNNNGNDNDNDESTNRVDTDSNEMSISTPPCEAKKTPKIVTPWDVCQWGILSMPKSSGIKRKGREIICLDDATNIDDDNKLGDSVLLDPDDADNLVRNLTESRCPSILAWTKEHLEVGKKKQQSQKTRKQKKRNRPSGVQDENDALVCTTFPRLGTRPSNVKYYCPCDSNPFCLGSMGGVINELLKERCEKAITISIMDDDMSVDGDRDSKERKRPKTSESDGESKTENGQNSKNHDAEIEIVDVDEITNTVAEEESGGIFAFMGENKATSSLAEEKKSTEKDDIKKKPETDTVERIDVVDEQVNECSTFSTSPTPNLMDQISHLKKQLAKSNKEKTALQKEVSEETKQLHELSTKQHKSEGALTTTATCKRLVAGSSKPERGDPAEIYSSKNNTACLPLDDEGYSQSIKDELAKLRKKENVDLSKVEHYIKNVFRLFEHSGSDAIAMTMDEYMQTLVEWHKSLIFMSSMSKEVDSSSSTITIALPPGIQNLGATCYLNTQLQCLAQNPVFLDGIFSWRPVNSTHMMNGVMEQLQKLLADMQVGGDNKYTSLDFSNALGIQHNEQQDPNEFARLLFDRMEESFQQCSVNSSVAGSSHENSSNENGLGKLLQRIFHGTTTYETICMKCGKTSVRSEGFMDLNLPIVQRQHFEEDETDDADNIESNNGGEKDGQAFVKRKRRKKGMLEKAFEKQRKNSLGDTDVQYCFDQYTKPETLDGDNQYFCDACNCKQDAKRVMTLTELPPVLNIQLSRYVFDREKFIKKKLTDKVRLPTVLRIDQHSKGAGANAAFVSNRASKKNQNLKKKYLLCAVMRHQGTSAYSGHYVAEAMDWTIGQWYEFNDETVKVLTAPSNSYVPHDYLDLEDENIKNESMTVGSQDAYNMYYVDEEYLGKNAITTMCRIKGLNSIQNREKIHESNGIDELRRKLIVDKINDYAFLTNMCHDDYVIMDRLRRRKDGIRKHMFVNPCSLLLQEGQREEENEPYFWVDGTALRQFLACDRSLDEKLSSGDPIVCPDSLLCRHGYLHPRNARCGKLLRKSLYDSYVSLLLAEREHCAVAGEFTENDDVIGCRITAEEDIICQDCSKSYRNELGEKLEFLRNINDLYVDIIDETKDSIKGPKVGSIKGSVEEEYSYIVARSTITKFKKHVIDLMKSVADFSQGGHLEMITDYLDSENNTVLDGIDGLDMSYFPGFPSFLDTRIAGMDDTLDEKFNSKITCPHGNCNDFGLRVVRYVPFETWTKIKKVFPNAIDHKVLIYMVDGKVRKPNIEDDGCVFCRKEKDAIKNLTRDIELWAKETKANPSMKKLLDGKKISVGEIEFHNFDSARNNCRLVHRDDIANLCKSVRVLGKISKLKIPENFEMKTYVENIAFPSYHSIVLDFEKQPNARLLQSIRSLICCEHKRVIKSAIIDTFGSNGEVQQRHQLSNNIAVLSDEEYNSYINSLAELLIILNCDYQKEEGAHQGASEEEALTLVDDVKKFAASCHPAITMTVGENIPSDEVILFSLDGNSKEFSIVPGICDCETCKKDFVPMIQKNVEAIVESVSVDSTDTVERNRDSGGNSDPYMGLIAMKPIVVESDLEDCKDADNTLSIRVFQYLEDSELSDALQSLRTVVGLPNSDNNVGLNFGLRRSSRKRKSKFPVGCITCEETIDIGLYYNVAAIRLLLLQNCQIPLGCKLSISVFSGGDSPTKGLDIAFDWSKKTLNDLIEQLNMEGDIGNLVESNPSEHLFLLYKADKDNKSGEIENTLMDSMLQIANIESSNSKSNTTVAKKARKRSSERGFQGTLLQSSSTSRPTGDQKDGNGDDSCCEVEADPKKVERRPRSNTLVSDDEIETQKTMTEKDAVSDSSDGEVAIVPSPPRPVKRRNTITDDQKMELVCVLLKITDSKDQSACFEAISWAITSNPYYSESEVIDTALAKFFDFAAP